MSEEQKSSAPFSFPIRGASVSSYASNQLSSSDKSLVARPTKTKDDNDCAFHAVLGEWHEKEQQVVCAEAKQRRAEVARAITDSKAGSRIRELAVAGIKELIMTGRAVGEESQQLLQRYQQFLSDQNALSPQLWKTFEATLRQYPDVINYIAEHHQHPQHVTASLREQFYDALNRNEGELYGIIRSLTVLDTAFKQYNELQQTHFDWEGAISPKVLVEYAQFVGKPGQWLLPSEVALLAEVFNITVNYYPAPNIKPEVLNPGQKIQVSVQFNGVNHFERMSIKPPSSSRLEQKAEEKAPQGQGDNKPPAPTAGAPISLRLDKLNERLPILINRRNRLHALKSEGHSTDASNSELEDVEKEILKISSELENISSKPLESKEQKKSQEWTAQTLVASSHPQQTLGNNSYHSSAAIAASSKEKLPVSSANKAEIKHTPIPMAEEAIAALLVFADCLHPQLPLADKTEQNYLTQLATALAKGEFDEAAYTQLFTRLEAGSLSLAALYRFANVCYQHWQHQWPTASALHTQQVEIERQTAQLQAMAQGRTLFRRSGTPTRYYWGRTNASGNDAIEKGLFFACYPTFAAQGESVKAIYQAELITDAAHIALCEAHTQAKRRQQSFSQLLHHSSLLHKRLQRHGHHAKIVVNLQLAWLYYRSGHVASSLSIHETGQAVFYFRQAMGQIARHAFTQQQPALPATLITAAEQVRERVDQAVLGHAQQTLFAVQSATLITRWQQCYQDAQLDAIYQLSQQTHTLLTHAVSVPLAAKQPLIDSWLAGFNRGLAEEDEQEVRVAMQSAVLRTCNPLSEYPHSLTTVHQWLLQLAQQLQQHGETSRAQALLHTYQQLLIYKQPKLQENLAGPKKTAYIAILAACEQALKDLDQWLTPTRVAEAKPLTQSSTPVSAFATRSQELETWRKTLTQSFAKGVSAGDIYTANTEFAHNLLADICREIEQQIGPPPCAYTLLGAGSFSRGEISPASDLDCALLVADASVKIVDKDNSSKITFHPWFQCFLQLLQWKLASLPEGVLSLESETLAWISKGFWFDTSEGLIEQHLISQQPNDPKSVQQPENFGAQWLRWIYSSGNQPQAKDALFSDYQQRLQRFFHAPIDANSSPAYRQLAPWSLTQHVGQSVIPEAKALSLSPIPAQVDDAAKEAKETEDSEHEVMGSLSELLGTNTFTVLNIKNLSYRLINAILCYGRFYNIPPGMTTTRDVLAHLKQHQCLPASFIARLETALEQLYTWRLRQHWAWLHQASELKENEVVLWPEDTLPQAAIQALPPEWRGFYLDKTETQQCLTILHTVAEVIGRSVDGFTKFGRQQLSVKAEVPTGLSPQQTTSFIPQTASGIGHHRHHMAEAKGEVVEAKTFLQPSAAQQFNPLSAAVEWTLQQLAKPKDSKTSTEGHSSQAMHVQWLAQLTGTHAEELPISEPHSNDPARVKQDPLFRRYWQVYRAVPTHWRALYIEQLRQNPAVKLDVVTESLSRTPNNVGWRLSTQISEQQWQQALRPLFAAEPRADLPPEAKAEIAQGKAVWVSWVDQEAICWAPLRQECVNVLIDAKQQGWQPKHNLHGNHRLYALQTPSHSFWVKAYPEQPGTEYLVTALDRRLGVNGTPPQQLMALHHAPLRVADGTPQKMQIKQSAILLSQHVADAKYTLHRRIKREPQFLEKLDFLAFAKTLLRVLLTNPEDDKGSDYFLVPLSGTDRYQLVRIDNERAFLPVTHLTAGKRPQEELQVKSILYCLDQMLLPWSSDPRTVALLDDLHQLQPSELILDLLQEIECQQRYWQQLFPETAVKQHACLQDPWMSLPVFMLPQGLESALLKRFTSLQTALRLLKPQAITGLKLLEVVQPKLAKYYNLSLFQGKLARNPQQPQANVRTRFDHVAGRYYRQSTAQSASADTTDNQVSTQSGPAVYSRQLSLALPELPKTADERRALMDFAHSIWSQQAHSIKQALQGARDWQHLQAMQISKGLLALQPEAQTQFGWLPAREQQQVLDQLLSRQAAHIVPLSSKQQQFLLIALAGAQCHNLDLRPFANVLTGALLTPILVESGQQLLRLNISGCTLLKPDILSTIAKHCKHLKHLMANDQIRWTSLSLDGFDALTRFECNNATALTKISVGSLPVLKYLSLQNATALSALTNQGLGILAATPWRLPVLQRLDIRGCPQLRTVHLWLNQPGRLINSTIKDTVHDNKVSQSIAPSTIDLSNSEISQPTFSYPQPSEAKRPPVSQPQDTFQTALQTPQQSHAQLMDLSLPPFSRHPVEVTAIQPIESKAQLATHQLYLEQSGQSPSAIPSEPGLFTSKGEEELILIERLSILTAHRDRIHKLKGEGHSHAKLDKEQDEMDKQILEVEEELQSVRNKRSEQKDNHSQLVLGHPHDAIAVGKEQRRPLRSSQNQVSLFLEAKKEAAALPSHLEQNVTDLKERDLLLQFSAYTLDAHTPAVQYAYESLIRGITSTLSPLSSAARPRFANLCYSYWSKVLLPQVELAQLRTEEQNLRQLFAGQAQGRILFRSTEQPTRYYWAYAQPRVNTDNVRKGLFLQCYPRFEHGSMFDSEGITMIYAFTEITEATAVQQCNALQRYHQQYQRQQRLWADINTLCQAFKQQGTERLVAHLQITRLCLQKGYLGQDCFAAFQADNAVYFLKPALNAYLDQTWMGTPALSSSLISVVRQLRDAVDEALVSQAQTKLMELQLKPLQQETENLLENPTYSFSFQAFYQLMQKVLNAAHTFTRFPALYQPVLARLTQQLAQDANTLDVVRRELNADVSTICNPLKQSEDQLLSLTAQVLELVTNLQPHDIARANALLQWYQARLMLQLEKLSKQLEWAPDNAYYKSALSHCQTAITQCQILQTSAASQSVTMAASALASDFAKRETMLLKWHHKIAEALAQNRPITILQACNTTFAKVWFAGLCREVECQLGMPPCAFVFTGSGSLSRGEISVCSDIDFQLLVADSSAQSQTYFQAFLRLLVWKATVMPSEVLNIEHNTLRWIADKFWWGTPQELIDQHLYLPVDGNRDRMQHPESVMVQWLTPLYVSQNQPTPSQTLFQQYQSKLAAFFHPQGAVAPYPYQLHALWSLQQHLNRSYTFKMDDKDSATPKTMHLRSTLYPIIHALLCYARFMGIVDVTDTQQLLAYLVQQQFLPPLLLSRITRALADLQRWRLAQHWASVHYPYPAGLGEDEVFLWPAEPTQQAVLSGLPKGFYLTAEQTTRLHEIQASVVEVIYRNVEGFVSFAMQLPTLAIDPTTASRGNMAGGVKEFKREVSEEEAQVIIASQSRRVTEAKDSTLSSTTHLFNPLAAAIEWTLRQLTEANPPQRTTVEHITWLAQVMGNCAAELPEGRPHTGDSTRAKQDPLFRRHWQVYRAIPLAWRSLYIAQLRQNSDVDAATIVEPLTHAPNNAGWRLSTQIGEQQWQQALRVLFAAEPRDSLPPEAKTDIVQGKAVWVSWVDQEAIRWAPLRQEYSDALIDSKTQHWKSKDSKISGNHQLYQLQTTQERFWLKLYPEQPGTEYLVTALDRRLGANGTPPQQLLALHHAPLHVPSTSQGMRIEHSAALLIPHIADSKQSLHRICMQYPEQLDQLDFITFAKTLLRVLLTNPEDDKGDDYFLIPLPSTNRYQLIRIDNERAFFPITTGQGWREELQVKSILYCLDQMLFTWDGDPRTAQLLDDLQQLQPSALIADLLKDIEQQHAHWRQLFPETSIIQHARLRYPSMSIPTFLLPQGLETALLKRFTSLQTALRLLKPQAVTGLKLLELVQPKLARYYNRSLFQGKLARNPQQPQASVLARFNQVAGRYYQNNPQSLPISSDPPLFTRRLSITLPGLSETVLREVWLQQAQSVKQALETVATWQHPQAEGVIRGLLALRPEAQTQFGLLSAREQQQMLTQLLSKQVSLSSQQQQFLLTALAGAQCHNLDLRSFATVLNEALLTPILTESGQQMLRLDISSCTLLKSDILGVIAKHCKHLKHLTANDQIVWTSLSLDGFDTLTRFECNNAANLMGINFGRLPALKRLSLQYAPRLTALGNQGFITANTTAWHLPVLQHLDIRGCKELRTIHLWVEQPEKLVSQMIGGETSVLADSKTSQSLATSQTTPSTDSTSSAAFFQPAPRSQLVDAKESRQEHKNVPKRPATQARLAAVQALIDTVYPASDLDNVAQRTSYREKLSVFHQYAELTPEDLQTLETLEKELQEKQTGLLHSLQPMG